MQINDPLIMVTVGIAFLIAIWAALRLRIRLILKYPFFFQLRTCFLVSDKDWQSVFGLIPIAYRSRPIAGSWLFACFRWFIGRLFGVWFSLYTLFTKNPVLVFHEEDNGAIDVDSIIHFLQQYQPTFLYLIGDTPQELDDILIAPTPQGAALNPNQIVRIYPDNYLTFWSVFSKVVVVGRSDYKSALMATVFASLKSIPIFFVDNNNLDTTIPHFQGKKVYLVGTPLDTVTLAVHSNASSVEHFNHESLVAEYIRLTKTRKLIMINPNDLEISISTNFQPEKTANTISTLFVNGSLPAPILAAARHEIIIYPTQNAPTRQDFDNIVEDYANNWPGYFKYLTILGTPDAIPQSIPANPPTGWGHRLELDGRHYGSIQLNLDHVDLATGRIYGISTSDVSGNIARSLFYAYLPRNKMALVLPREDVQSGIDVHTDEEDLEDYYRDNYWTNTIENKFATTYFYSGHAEIADNKDDIQDRYEEAHLVFFADHGGSESFAGVMNTNDFENDQIYLTCTTVIDLACSTGRWDQVSDADKPRLFVVQSIRRGAIVQMAAVSVSYWHQMFDELLNEMYISRKSLGKAFRIAKNSEFDRNAFNYSIAYDGDPWYFLMGDPVFVPKWW